jgi:hypothetical protein
MSVKRIADLDRIADRGERLGMGALGASAPSITVGSKVDPWDSWAFQLGFRVGLGIRGTLSC